MADQTTAEPLLTAAEIDRRDRSIAAAAAELERARIVAWLREIAGDVEHILGDPMAPADIRWAADRIEDGAHVNLESPDA